MLREVYAAGHELHDAAAEAGGGLADAASERNSQLVVAFWRVAGRAGARFRAVAARGDAARSEGGDQRLAAGRRRLQFRHQLTGHRAGLSARRGGGTAHDADPVRHPAKRYGRRRTLCARGGDGRGGGRGAIRRHRPEVAGAGGAFRLRQGLLCLDRRLSAAHRPRRHRGTRRVAQRQPRQPVREAGTCALAQEPHDGARNRSGCHDPQPELFPVAVAAGRGSWRWSRPRATEPAISRLRSCCSIRVSTIWPWRSPTRVCCCASGASRCPSWYSTPMPTVSTRWSANRLEPEIYSLRSLHEFAAAVERYGEQRYPIHVKLDTGMHRLGFVEEELPALLDALARYAGGRCVWRASSRTSVRRTIPRRTISRGCRSRVSTA